MYAVTHTRMVDQEGITQTTLHVCAPSLKEAVAMYGMARALDNERVVEDLIEGERDA